jgi:O-succinylbenzoic acid--CoA ligase
MTRNLRPVPVGDVPALLAALAAALAGAADALLPHAEDQAPAAGLRPGEPLGPGEDDPADPTAVVLSTSGSTGPPKGALLPASALLASASATHDRLGGPGRWLLALPAQHVAGIQVLVRSLVARRDPVLLPGPFAVDGFVAAAGRLSGPRRYTALVPAQVLRLLDAGAADALASFDAVLVGGSSTPPALLERAAGQGVRLVTTYGMSETAGGCVYDGRPLDGVRVGLEDGRISLGGPMVARGYRGGAPFAVDEQGMRWFRTDDGGRWDGDRLAVLGRLDDVIVTGGLKVAPALVEAALAGAPGVGEVVVVGVPDERWGRRVVAAVVPVPGAPPPTLEELRTRVRESLPAYAAPRQLLLLQAMPRRGPGKPDRITIADLAARA